MVFGSALSCRRGRERWVSEETAVSSPHEGFSGSDGRRSRDLTIFSWPLEWRMPRDKSVEGARFAIEGWAFDTALR